MTESTTPLLGVGDVPLWVIVSLYIGGAALIYLGLLGRGFARVFITTLGLAVLAWAFAPQISNFLDAHPDVGSCATALAQLPPKWADCSYLRPYLP